MPANARNLSTTIALTCVMAVLLCLVETASAVAAKSPEKTASGIFFADPNIYTGEILPESLQPQWEIDPAATPTASGRQVWLSADPIGEAGGLNLYAYVEGNPINDWDMLGLIGGFGIVEAPGWSVPDSSGTYGTKRDVAIAAGGTVGVCAAAALPTAAVAIGPGGQVSSAFPGFHVAFGAGGQWLHGLGQVGAMRITSLGAEAFAANAWLRVAVPVLSSKAVTETSGSASLCVTAAAKGIARGWWKPIVDAVKSLF